MLPENLHPLLKRQLKRSFGEDIPVHPGFEKFLQGIHQSYIHYDSNLELIERAMKLSSEELFQKNALLAEESERQAQLIDTIKKSIQELSPNHDSVEEHSVAKIIEILNESIHERKSFERRLEESREKAEAALETRKLFLANISHEIRTPINAIFGMSEVLEDTPLNQEQKDYLHAIQSSSESLMVIVNDILDMAKLESGKFQIEELPFNLKDTLTAIHRGLSLRAEEKGISFQLRVAEAVPTWVKGDPTRLKQIITNLVSNAIKFTEEGTVDLIVDPAGTHSSELKFEVRDSGIGIEEHKLATIFEYFVQEDSSITRRYGGTGLGLAISKSLAEQLKGQLICESQKGKGSTFTLTLPLPETEQTTREKQFIIPSLTGARILIVEDNALNRFLAVTVLSKANATIFVAENGEEALNILRNEEVDVVLMDIQMPVMDGMKATEHIRNTLHLSVPILALTANALQSEREKCLELGMNDYITKPYNPDDLILKIHHFVHTQHHRPMSQQLEQVNLENLLKLISGSNAYAKTITEKFVHQIHSEFDHLQEYARSNEMDFCEHTAHKLIATFKLYGLNSIATTLEAIEHAARSKDEAQVLHGVNSIYHLKLEIIAQINQAVDALSQTA